MPPKLALLLVGRRRFELPTNGLKVRCSPYRTVPLVYMAKHKNGLGEKHQPKSRAQKPWYLYLIECVDGSIYTGVTVDVSARYSAHMRGKGSRYTRSHPPSRLIKVIKYSDRSTASKAERVVKKLSALKKRIFARGGREHLD